MMSSDCEQTIEGRAQKYLRLFDPSPSQLIKCYESFILELQRGLEMHHKYPETWHPELSSFMMLDTCIDFVPTGKEKGIFYAVDFGGTNMRAVRINLDGQGHASLTALRHNIRNEKVSSDLPKGLLDKKATASMLFDEISAAVGRLMKQEGDTGLRDVGVGLTFSFGLNQMALNNAILTGWTKGFETGMESNDPVIGRDVCALLDKAFERQKIHAKVTAALNDTVGALLAGAYSKPPHMPPCVIGIILGTGVNGAYFQPNAREYGFEGVIVNTELGGFDKDIPRTDIDLEIDFTSTSYGRQRFEKMISGMYLPELCRLLVLRVFQKEAPPLVWVRNSLTGAACAAVINDSLPLSATLAVLEDLWEWKPSNDAHILIIHSLFSAAFRRSAALAAVAIAAMAKSTGRLQQAMGGVTVGVDGTLYVQNAIYQDMVKESLVTILGSDISSLINLCIAEDGSGKGAAVLAGTIANASIMKKKGK